MLATPDEARRFPTASVELAICGACGFVANTQFDAVWSAYAPNYEDQQSFSKSFNAFAYNLAAETIARFGLEGKSVVEIGCSKGDFLATLCEVGAMNAVGVDPSAVEGRVSAPSRGSMRLVQDYFGPQHCDLKADLICCRHTLEHIQPVHETLVLIRKHMERNPGSVLLIEVPDARRIWANIAFEDVYYEHCSYFTAGTLSASMRRAGFSVLDLRREYDDQYLVAFGSLDSTADRRFAVEESAVSLHQAIASFSQGVAHSIDAWRNWIQKSSLTGKRQAIWGSGSKCVAFLHTLDAAQHFDMIIDINPHRTGRFAPGLGTAICSPDELLSEPIDQIVLMNSIYLNEIQATLDAIGVHPEILTIDQPPR